MNERLQKRKTKHEYFRAVFYSKPSKLQYMEIKHIMYVWWMLNHI